MEKKRHFVGKGMEHRAFFSRDKQQVLKVPRGFNRLLGLTGASNIDELKRQEAAIREEIQSLGVDLKIPKTRYVKQGNSYVIVQERIHGDTPQSLPPELAEALKTSKALDKNNLRNFIQTPDGSIYYIDLSRGFFERINQRGFLGETLYSILNPLNQSFHFGVIRSCLKIAHQTRGQLANYLK